MSLKDPANQDGYNSPSAFPYSYRQKRSFIHKIYSESRFMIHFVGKVRRLYLVNFRKKYVQKRLALRRGACRRCGTCCNLLITCPMLLKKGGCVIYGLCRPQTCKVFPIDQRDLREVRLCNGACGFHFGLKGRVEEKTDQTKH